MFHISLQGSDQLLAVLGVHTFQFNTEQLICISLTF